MKACLVRICLLGSALAAKSFMANIGTTHADAPFIKAVPSGLGIANDSAEDASIFGVVIKKKKGSSRMLARNRYRMSISPMVNTGMYLAYSRKAGIMFSKKKRFWKYRELKSGYVMLGMDGDCLNVTDRGEVSMVRCNKKNPNQRLLVRKHICDQEEAYQDDVSRAESVSSSTTQSDSSHSSSSSAEAPPIVLNLNLKDMVQGIGDLKAASVATSTSTVVVTKTEMPRKMAETPRRRAECMHVDAYLCELENDDMALSEILEGGMHLEEALGLGARGRIDRLTDSIHRRNAEYSDLMEGRRMQTKVPMHAIQAPYVISQQYAVCQGNPMAPVRC